MTTKEQAERREQARKRRETWRFMTPMSMDNWIGPKRTMNTQNHEDGRN